MTAGIGLPLKAGPGFLSSTVFTGWKNVNGGGFTDFGCSTPIVLGWFWKIGCGVVVGNLEEGLTPGLGVVKMSGNGELFSTGVPPGLT